MHAGCRASCPPAHQLCCLRPQQGPKLHLRSNLREAHCSIPFQLLAASSACGCSMRGAQQASPVLDKKTCPLLERVRALLSAARGALRAASPSIIFKGNPSHEVQQLPELCPNSGAWPLAFTFSAATRSSPCLCHRSRERARRNLIHCEKEDLIDGDGEEMPASICLHTNHVVQARLQSSSSLYDSRSCMTQASRIVSHWSRAGKPGPGASAEPHSVAACIDAPQLKACAQDRKHVHWCFTLCFLQPPAAVPELAGRCHNADAPAGALLARPAPVMPCTKTRHSRSATGFPSYRMRHTLFPLA